MGAQWVPSECPQIAAGICLVLTILLGGELLAVRYPTNQEGLSTQPGTLKVIGTRCLSRKEMDPCLESSLSP